MDRTHGRTFEKLTDTDIGSSMRSRRNDIVSLRPDLEERITGYVWDLSAAIDKLASAVTGFPFASAKDRRICQLLSQAVPWHRIASRLRCSKRRVARVNRTVRAWKQPEAA